MYLDGVATFDTTFARWAHASTPGVVRIDLDASVPVHVAVHVASHVNVSSPHPGRSCVVTLWEPDRADLPGKEPSARSVREYAVAGSLCESRAASASEPTIVGNGSNPGSNPGPRPRRSARQVWSQTHDYGMDAIA